jgi:hypothetical protein
LSGGLMRASVPRFGLAMKMTLSPQWKVSAYAFVPASTLIAALSVQLI